MYEALDAVGFLAGVAVVVGVILSAVQAVVLPRAAQARLPAYTTYAVRRAFRLRVRRARSFEDKDRLLAMLAPVALLTMLGLWLLLIIAAYTLMYFCVTGRSVTRSIQLSGSSVFTLGTSTDARLGPSLLTYSEAALGLLLVALFITYFPSIYSGFSRREAGVALFEVRAGVPPIPVTMLTRFHRIDGLDAELGQLWAQWEAWFADIEETHTTFPILAFFRSPQPHRNWVTAAGALLDGASLWSACIDHAPDPAAQLCIRGGFLALRRIADGFGIRHDADPDPTDPIAIQRHEWESVMDALASAGLRVRADRDQAWRDWSGWRVNYDTVLLSLAALVEAPVVPWVSDRSPTTMSAEGRPLAGRALIALRSSARPRGRGRRST